MKFSTILGLASTVSLSFAAPTYGGEDSAQTAARLKFSEYELRYQANVLLSAASLGSKCNVANIQKRQEWGTLSRRQRLNYIDAVKCLQQKPATISKKIAPGAVSRFDDFVATHLIQTPFIHNDGVFLAWHRYFVYLYEKALREECGYRGNHPYWDWTISYQDPTKSTVFDGSDTSLGGNGAYVPHGPTTLHIFGITFPVPPGTGGGCVTSGPFASPKYYNISLGPVATDPVGPQGGLGANPRCFTRDLNPLFSTNFTKPTDVLKLVSSCSDLGCWNGVLEGPFGTHPAGHLTMGGDGMDIYTPNNDPAFYLHHANVDRMWSIWQGQNPSNRTNQVFGTQTAFNQPPSDPVTLDTLLDFGVLSPKQTVRSVTSVTGGQMCYIYV